MAGLLDLVSGLMGRPDPTMQLMQGMGQAPGQGVNPTPLPGGPQAPPGGQGGPPATPGAGAGPQGPGGPQQPPQQPQAQAYTSTPDMAAMNQQLAQPGNLIKTYMDMQARQYQGEQFNRGLAMLLGGMKGPPNQLETMLGAAQGLQPSAHQTMSDVMQLYDTQYQLQQRQALMASLPKMLADAGISQDYAPYIMANPGILGEVLKTRMGLGDQATQSMHADMTAQTNLHGPADTASGTFKDGKPLPDWWGDPLKHSETVKAGIQGASTEAQLKTHDIRMANDALPGINEQADDAIARIDRILANKNLGNVLGPQGLMTSVKGWAGLDPDSQSLLKEIGQLGAQTYAQGLSSEALKGSRKTQAEGAGVAKSLSQVADTNQSEASYRYQLELLRYRLMQTKANAKAETGNAPSGELSGYESPDVYSQGGVLAGQTPPRTFAARPVNPLLQTATPQPAQGGGGGGGTQQPTQGAGGGGGGAQPAGAAPPVPGAQKAPDGNWYLPDPKRPGKYLRVD